MQVDLCRHIKSNGIQCHAVALRDGHFCYFHKRLNEGHSLYRSTMVGKRRLLDRGFIIPIPPLEDRVSVQLALSEVINALACNFIDSKRANALFFGLKLAAANAKGLETITEPKAMVRDYTHAPDILESVAVELAPAGRTCEIDEPAESAPTEDHEPIRPTAPATPGPTTPAKDPLSPVDPLDEQFDREFAAELARAKAEALAYPIPALYTTAPTLPITQAEPADPQEPETGEPNNEELDREFKALFAESRATAA
jgi:hypothetical protein